MTAEAKLSFNTTPSSTRFIDRFCIIFSEKCLNGVSQAEAKLNEIEFNPQPKPKSDTSQSLAHAFGRVGYNGSFVYSSEDPTAIALKKFSETKFDVEAMEQAEDAFVKAVDDSIIKNRDFLSALVDLVAIQLSYFKSAHELLVELSPQIDELQVTEVSQPQI
ncbi:hypothetical protein HDU92_000583 [Lobulomyces angularis]|nr:hypothetical protein HDU92_000583 [Lobulomyces angularis]